MAKRIIASGVGGVAVSGLVVGVILSLFGLARAQQTQPVRPAPPKVVALQPVAPEVGPAWQSFVALRQRLGLPVKKPFVPSLSRSLRQRVAMTELAKAARVASQAQLAAERASLDPGRWAEHVMRRDLAISGCFRAALQADPGCLQALLALANTANDPVVARLAIEAAQSRNIAAAVHAGDAERVTERTVTLLATLLASNEARVAEAAWSQLQWLLEADPPAVPAMRALHDLAQAQWPKHARQVVYGPWDANRRNGLSRQAVLAFPVPADLPSRLVVLASMVGNADVLQHITADGYDPRIVLHCHSLMAHRCDRAMARQLFGWYSRHVARWKELKQPELNAWEWGVVATLVGVLPKLGEKSLGYYAKHLSRGRVGAAARLVSVHRMLRLARQPGCLWLDLRWLDSDQVDAQGRGLLDLEPLQALQLWRYLASHREWSLAGCVAALSDGTTNEARDRLLVELLACAPASDGELGTLAKLRQKERPAVAAAVVRRVAGSGQAGRKQAQRWLQQGVSGTYASEAFAYALAVELGLPLRVREPRADAASLRGRLRELCRAANAPAGLRSEALARPLRQAIAGAQRVDLLDGGLCALLNAARLHPRWWPELGHFVASHTTHADPQVRHSAYRALAAGGAAEMAEALLAGEAQFDCSAKVRGR